MLPAHTTIPHNRTHKIASLYFEFKYQQMDIAEQIPITFEQVCTLGWHS